MIKKFLLVVLLFLLPLISFAQESNAGFVSGIWFSKTPFFKGETIRIYSAVQNHSGYDITGTIKFFNNGEIIGESEFSAINGRLVEKWIDWKVIEGEHEFQVKIFDPKKSTPNGGEESISLLSGSSEVRKIFADTDTDKDGIGNREDNDDDADGITDKEEEKNGTNPLVFNKTEESAQTSQKNESESRPESIGKVEEGKEIAEKFIVEPAKVATEKVLDESKPVIEKIGDLLKEKQKVVEGKIEEDREKDLNSNLAAVSESGFYEKIREKLPPTFRILYNWFLKFLILLFSVWWIPLMLVILIVLRILLGVYRRMKYR